MRGSDDVSVDSPNIDTLDRWAAEVRRVEKPWGYELIWAVTGAYCGKVLFVRAGQALSLQFHREKDESWYVQSGRAKLERSSFTQCEWMSPVITTVLFGARSALAPNRRSRAAG